MQQILKKIKFLTHIPKEVSFISLYFFEDFLVSHQFAFLRAFFPDEKAFYHLTPRANLMAFLELFNIFNFWKIETSLMRATIRCIKQLEYARNFSFTISADGVCRNHRKSLK